jgi:hypothetical protein
VKAGAARADITPTPSIELAGYAARVQPSTEVHDPLRLHGLFLESKNARLLWLHADLIGFGRELVDRIKRNVSQRVGLSSEKIFLSASHTHAGPPAMELLGCGALREGDEAYIDRLVRVAGDVAEASRVALVPVQMVEGVSTCRVAIDRRHRERGPREDEVAAIGFVREGGDYVAVLANYAVHPVSLNYRNRAISADLMGVAAEHVRRSLPGEPVVLMTNGACGDLNPPVQGGEFEPTERFGREVGDSVLRALELAEAAPDVVSCRDLTTSIPVEPWTKEQIRQRAQQVRDAQRDKDPIWATSSTFAAGKWEAMMLERYPFHETELAIQEAVIGGRRFIAIGAEVLSKMSSALKGLLGSRTSVVGYANGNVGYLCPDEAFEEGGYEPDLAFIYYGTPKITRGAFEEVVEHIGRSVLSDLPAP